MCEGCICDPRDGVELIDVGTGHGPQPYGPECVEVARGLSLGLGITEAVRHAHPEDMVVALATPDRTGEA